MANESWTQNPSLAGIDPARLQTLISFAEQAKGKNQSELLPFLMAASQNSSGQLSFQSSEIDAIIEVLKIGKSPQEIQKIDQLCMLVKQFRRQQNHDSNKPG